MVTTLSVHAVRVVVHVKDRAAAEALKNEEMQEAIEEAVAVRLARINPGGDAFRFEVKADATRTDR